MKVEAFFALGFCRPPRGYLFAKKKVRELEAKWLVIYNLNFSLDLDELILKLSSTALDILSFEN